MSHQDSMFLRFVVGEIDHRSGREKGIFSKEIAHKASEILLQALRGYRAGSHLITNISVDENGFIIIHVTNA